MRPHTMNETDIAISKYKDIRIMKRRKKEKKEPKENENIDKIGSKP